MSIYLCNHKLKETEFCSCAGQIQVISVFLLNCGKLFLEDNFSDLSNFAVISIILVEVQLNKNLITLLQWHKLPVIKILLTLFVLHKLITKSLYFPNCKQFNMAIFCWNYINKISHFNFKYCVTWLMFQALNSYFTNLLLFRHQNIFNAPSQALYVLNTTQFGANGSVKCLIFNLKARQTHLVENQWSVVCVLPSDILSGKLVQVFYLPGLLTASTK